MSAEYPPIAPTLFGQGWGFSFYFSQILLILAARILAVPVGSRQSAQEGLELRDKSVIFDWFDHVVIDLVAYTFDGGLETGVAGDNYDNASRSCLSHRGDDGKPVRRFRKIQIAQQGIERVGFQ